MRVVDRLSLARPRARPRRRTVRFRLTAVYSVLFLIAGAALLAVTYLLVDRSTTTALMVNSPTGATIAVKGPAGSPPPHGAELRSGTPTVQELQLARQLAAQAAAQHDRDLHLLVSQSAVALGAMAALAVGLGWLMAGRVLRPLRTMTAATQQITERNLHERLALPGPSDEMKDLADTIDGLLARLETAFGAQRHFVANASHELLTPLTFDRALVEVALADPAATTEDLRATLEELLASGEQKERLIEALLTLARSERGLDRRERFDLAVATERALAPHRGEAEQRGLQVNTSLDVASVTGNPALTQRMVANLIENAVRYNVPAGSIDVRTETRDGSAVLTVANTGPPVPPDEVDRLFAPFQRIGHDRAAHQDGHGLGLSIVRAIATAHDAGIKVRLRPGGGLIVEIHFSARPASVNSHRHPTVLVRADAADRRGRSRPAPATGRRRPPGSPRHQEQQPGS